MDPNAAQSAPPPPPEDHAKLEDLSGKIDKSGCYARNEDSRYPMTNLFIGDTRLGCKSDADEQIIIHIEFQEYVKVHSIKFTEFNLGLDAENNPTEVAVFANRCNLGFEDIDDVDPTQEFELTAEDLKEGADPILLKFVKFQRVRSITLYIKDNAGGEISALGALKITGRPVVTTNMADFAKQG
eukprot:CAMPEP_0197246510 /NCGR_PEP_ID=MMETSP1429-20130617/14309_1 /TAXON_ID=49237 /ORGANISM="Chaetoceros  sp., Strain UNC1202" /LENGTH=183 /DNA_ID=CAMNT_0042707185 /DNA_START=18 /DNA_END=569 /DNA_ORIENTATION=+